MKSADLVFAEYVLQIDERIILTNPFKRTGSHHCKHAYDHMFASPVGMLTFQLFC